MNYKRKLNIYYSNLCNYKCTYCNEISGKRYNSILSIKDIVVLNNYISSYNINEVIINTGEPFLFKRNLFLIKKYLNRNIKYSIYTNGSLLNKYDLLYFKNDELIISYQAISNTEKNLNNIDIIKYKDIVLKLSIATVILFNNREWFKNLVELYEIMIREIIIYNDTNTINKLCKFTCNTFIFNLLKMNIYIDRRFIFPIYYAKLFNNTKRYRFFYRRDKGFYKTNIKTLNIRDCVFKYIKRHIG